MDLDRAYVVNGDDLRIALAGMNGRWPAVPDPRTMAGDILDVIAQPLGTAGVRVTGKQLAAALDGQWVYAKNRDGTHHGQVADADNVARDLLEKLAGQRAQKSGPWAPDDEVVDAHIHCEHAPESRAASELETADKIVALLGPHRYDGARYVKRVLRWAWDYLTDGDEPPF